MAFIYTYGIFLDFIYLRPFQNKRCNNASRSQKPRPGNFRTLTRCRLCGIWSEVHCQIFPASGVT